jgi:hypothetical protein
MRRQAHDAENGLDRVHGFRNAFDELIQEGARVDRDRTVQGIGFSGVARLINHDVTLQPIERRDVFGDTEPVERHSSIAS